MTTPRLREKFNTVARPQLTEKFGIKNPMALPTLEKIVLNVGMGRQLEGTKVNATAKEQVLTDLATITGQKAVMVKAKKSVSNFKVRIGYEIGAMVTLRGARMWEFFDRLVSVAIPRIKDFRGLKDNSFDGRGNYSFGITEQGIFPEIDMANAKFLHGMNITLVFKNSTNEVTKEALNAIGMPFVKRDEA
ncbi:MAG: 50S ribosomal protein L5 [Phycisphaeraceae bacterium]|nr:50S ribosomal protein L5 [Phycisphaeraceae bacterium]